MEEFDRLVAALPSSAAAAAPPAGELASVAVAVERVLRRGVDVADIVGQLDELAGECGGRTRDDIVDRLIGSRRLRGDRSTYGDWRNSCVGHVLRTGAGIPITLSIVVIEVARRCGVSLHGVGMPAHFLVGDDDDPDWFLDPFHGRELDRAGCQAALTEVSGGRISWRESFLAPASTIDIVTRMSNNLRAAFAEGRDPYRLALVMRMRTRLAGTGGGPRASAGDEEALVRQALAVFN